MKWHDVECLTIKRPEGDSSYYKMNWGVVCLTMKGPNWSALQWNDLRGSSSYYEMTLGAVSLTLKWTDQEFFLTIKWPEGQCLLLWNYIIGGSLRWNDLRESISYHENDLKGSVTYHEMTWAVVSYHKIRGGGKEFICAILVHFLML